MNGNPTDGPADEAYEHWKEAHAAWQRAMVDHFGMRFAAKAGRDKWTPSLLRLWRLTKDAEKRYDRAARELRGK